MAFDGSEAARTELATLRGVRKRYGAVTALDGLDLHVRPGELLAVLGPNGAGKSTAISLLLGLQRPDEGEALLFGRPPSDIAARRGMGVMMQEVALPQALRVHELIDQAASYYPAPMSVAEALALSGTEALARKTYSKLSGGQKRQAQFAIAVVGRPRLLFLDEPTAGLDVKARETLWAALRTLVAGGTSIVLTTHYIEEAEALADRVVVIAKGRCIAEGTVADMRALVVRKRVECRTRITRGQLLSWAEVEGVAVVDGRFSITTAEAEILVRNLLAADPDLSELEVRRAGLSEAFAELTQEGAQ
jgi:ABC-2 type transport system ATP-binding protein